MPLSLPHELIEKKLELLVNASEKILNDPEVHNIKGIKTAAGDDPERYRYWEWPQGVGLFGMWKMFERYKDTRYLAIIKQFYNTHLAKPLPARTVNTTAPMLALSYLAEYENDTERLNFCIDWADTIMHSFYRTPEGGLQHTVSGSLNMGQLWDDTLFMAVLFLANAGRILRRNDYLEEVAYQFLLHAKYLTDTTTGLWYHGFTFEGRHNFSKALWGRGNAWVTAAIPVFLEIARPAPPVFRFLQSALEQQVVALLPLQEKDGMFHTLLTDPSSYVETSATSGFGYGILKGIHDRILPEKYLPIAEAAVRATINNIDDEGVVLQVSGGTPIVSLDAYKTIPLRPMPYGQSLALLLLGEALLK